MRRRRFLAGLPSLVSTSLVACGGGESAVASAAESLVPALEPALEPALAAAPATPSTPPPASAVDAQPVTPPPATAGASASGLPTLTLHAGNSGDLPYLATAFPLPGVVSGATSVVSPDDTNLCSAVVSRWPDGSASVVVLAGRTQLSAGSTRQIALQPGVDLRPLLTPARVVSLVNSVRFDDASIGSASLTNFTTPQRIWWASSGMICCRYRLAIGNGGLEAVVDVHAFASDHAFVEVVIENGRVDLSAPVSPGAKRYAGATVSVNGSVIGSAGNPVPGSYNGGATYVAGTHEAFRAWYCSGWIGGNPGVEVTQDTATMQSHPLLFKVDQPSNQNLAALYGADAYVPWSTGRHRAAGMGAGGDHPSIGALTQWDTRYLQSGDVHARRAVLSNALAALSFGVNYRDAGSGNVPSYASTGTRERNSRTWPELTTEPRFEIAHHPAVGLTAFLCQPSPCFIEIAQKVALWNGTYAVGDWSYGPYAQVRGLAWSIRSQAHALFLTPDGHAWKASGRTALANAVEFTDSFRTAANNPLQLIWDLSTTERADFRNAEAGWQHSVWMHEWLATELHKVAAANVLAGTAQTAIDRLADWSLAMPVRQINESKGGEWRYQRYFTTLGRKNYDATNGTYIGGSVYAGSNQDSLPTFGEMFAWSMTDGPPAVSGPWKVAIQNPNPTSYSDRAFVTDAVANADLNYATHFWAALCMAVERRVPGADAAWNTVLTNLTGLNAWRQGFAADPRQGTYPRNK